MKSLQSLASFLLIVGLVYYSFFSLMPQKGSPSSVAETKFSTERALILLKKLLKRLIILEQKSMQEFEII